ncbi:serine/threonine-protein phosphatase [Streptomyces albofaciens JCM 4342]|uniref:PP2C family protein-serine/threonine phosphatase n=1 Tax=Streptomyces albofaciens TaxID=66866 RepID=UPI0012392112|nr:PP2C family protein-serine/threonine phosphatase [Streptomyces albofaciens]KAA6222913.1 serine/threonine-protein phosphatase [Streptomyces albofaciens JCM 4342]
MIRTWARRSGTPARAARARRAFVLVLPGLWVLGVLLWERCTPGDGQFLQLLAAAPAIACAGTGRRQCVVLGGLCALLALLPLGTEDPGAHVLARIGTCCAVLVVVAASYLTAGRRLRLLRELERTKEVATAAQRVLLRPLPARVDGIVVAADHLTADETATVGGDLYDVVATRHGVRAVIGDVRGHGIGALGTVAAVLGSFREAAHDEPDLGAVLRRLERALQRHLRERARAEHPASGGGEPENPLSEEFVTVLLVEIDRDGAVRTLNCGHPWPYRLSRQGALPEAPGEPMPPLGLFPLPADLPVVGCPPLQPGQAIFLHTDGATDARDAHGTFFPLPRALDDSVRSVRDCRPARVVEGVRAALLRHVGGRLSDDVALLVLCNDRWRVPAQAEAAPSARGRVRAGRVE